MEIVLNSNIKAIIMKIRILLLFITLGVCISCDELEELLEDREVTVTTSYVNTISIDSPMTSNPDDDVSFQAGGGFDFLNNADVAEVIGTPEQIKKIEIVSIKYEYKNFSGNVDAKTKGSYFYLATEFMNGETFPVQNENVAEADLLGSVFNLSGDFSQVNSFITDGKIFSYVYSGSLTDNPAVFSVEVTITAKLTLEVNLDDL